jgi:hypothetical protein
MRTSHRVIFLSVCQKLRKRGTKQRNVNEVVKGRNVCVPHIPFLFVSQVTSLAQVVSMCAVEDVFLILEMKAKKKGQTEVENGRTGHRTERLKEGTESQ